MNSLESFNTTNLHTHGLHVSPSGVSDNVLLQISPGATQNYKIVLPPDHPAGTYWYHAHKHGSTAANVGSGMSGAIIIEGGEDAVAEIAKAKERVFVLQQIPFYVDPDNNPEKLGVIEQKYADKCFGPGTWDTLKHHTTINGATLPTIRMKPGAVERWRFVDSAIREVIIPELVRLTPKSKAPKRLPLNEIAVDGISIGRVAPRDSVELWPGYRSDVLIKAPENAAGAVYVLRDTRTPSDPKNLSESRRYLALLVIEGGPDAMQLPKSEDLAKYRPASIDPGKVTAQQFAALGLVNSPVKKTFQFTIDRAPFDGTKARFLKLGETHEWTVTSRNPNVGPVPHPFHIHVNPFEIYSITNSSGQEQLDLDATGKPIPVWKDTIIAHEGWKVMFRTEYKDFTGTYVQHCHILDHEDQGMMELVEVYADPPAAKDTAVLKKLPVTYPAPLWTLPEASGKTVSLSEMVKRPTVLVFLEGLKCPRCNVQLGELKKLADDFEKSDVQIIVVTFDSVRNLKEMTAEMDLPFPMVTDPSLKTYKAYGCHAGMPLHGVFILDSQAQVRWQVVSTVPLMDLESVRAHAASLAPKLSSIK
jgi:FtsP/CotA-like multicopper oxidase with cupredoxin domain/peroxiredoxin